jgi:hypothetical protein
LESTPGSSYVWKQAASILSATTQTYSATEIGSYTVIVTGSNGCTAESAPKVIEQAVSLLTPTFASPAAICSGLAPSIPTTSINGITGSWAPAFAAITANQLYTFTAASGQCVSSTIVTSTVNVTPIVTPEFATPTAICSGQVASLPLTSTNSVTGLWLPAFAAITADQQYTFTATTAGCYTTAQVTVPVTQNVTPAFATPIAICSGQVASLPLTSTNSVTGTWLPAFAAISADQEYTFTATTAGCYTTAQVTVPVTQNVTPDFATPVAICSGQVASLPLTSTNSVTGTWLPAFAKITADQQYTFTATTAGCYTTAQVTVPVSALKVVPTFTLVDWVCKDSLAITLPLTSTNSIEGTWKSGTPSIVVTTISTIAVGEPAYTFTPTSSTPANNCPQTFTKSIKVIECLVGGVEEAIISPFTIYPNPSNDVISISFSELTSKNGTIRFISAEGKLIESREYTNSSVETFDVKSLNPGVYFLQIDNSIEKVIVQ